MTKARIEASNEDTAYWAARPYLCEETRAKLPKADVLVVPQEDFRGEDIVLFPVRTDEFYGFLKEQLGEKYSVELAIEDDGYKELALHSGLIILGTLVLTRLIAPIVVKVVSDYISQRLKGEAKKEAAQVRFEMIVQEQTADRIRAVKISYDGPALDFLPAMQEAIKQQPSPIVVDDTPPASPVQIPAPTEKKPDANP